MDKLAEIIMLPCDNDAQRSNIIKRKSDGLLLYTMSSVHGQLDLYETQQLYFAIENMEVDQYDWVLCPDNKTITRCVGYDADIKMLFVYISGAKCFIDGPDYKKIIASTVKKLNLPSISTAWINDYYVPSNGDMKFVDVKYELQKSYIIDGGVTKRPISCVPVVEDDTVVCSPVCISKSTDFNFVVSMIMANESISAAKKYADKVCKIDINDEKYKARQDFIKGAEWLKNRIIDAIKRQNVD